MKKKLLAVLLSAAMCAGILSGCGSTTATTENTADTSAVEESTDTATTEATATGEKKTIYFVAALSGGSCFGPCQEGFEKAGAELGYDAKWVGVTNAGDASEMADLCEKAINAGADGIVTLMMDEDILRDVLTRAKDAGLAVITVNSYTEDPYLDAWIGTDPVGCGKAQAQAVMDEFDTSEPINLVYMQSYLTTTTQNTQYETVVSELEAGGYTVNAPDTWHVEVKADATIAADTLTTLKKANPEINCVVMSDGNGSIGVMSYLRENGITDVKVVGIDDEASTLVAVKDGTFSSTVIQDFYTMGYDSVYLAKDVLDGKEVQFANDSGSAVLHAADIDEHAAKIGVTLE